MLADIKADESGRLPCPRKEVVLHAQGIAGYKGKHRAAMLTLLTRAPGNMWPTSFPFSFKNSAKLYGSPMLDAALRAALCGASAQDLAADDAQYGALLERLRAHGT